MLFRFGKYPTWLTMLNMDQHITWNHGCFPRHWQTLVLKPRCLAWRQWNLHVLEAAVGVCCSWTEISRRWQMASLSKRRHESDHWNFRKKCLSVKGVVFWGFVSRFIVFSSCDRMKLIPWILHLTAMRDNLNMFLKSEIMSMLCLIV